MMKFLLLLILTQCAVKCDDTSNYYVVEVPEDDPTTLAPRARRGSFRVYWNVPTMQCKSKKILFKLEEYGILQNKDDEFRGETITILYDPGLFPALLKNESSGELKFRNGGVPQEGNMTLHLDAFRTTLEQSIPDENFSGVGIIDFESWRPVYRQNFGVLVPYKDVSKEIEKKLHWWWTDEWIETEAKQRFEVAARAFMQTTLSVAKQMRPRALWGYYGFPYCFNMATNNKVEQCADNVNNENDGTYWLWSESTALFPSVYSSVDLTSSQLAALIRGRVKEANRVRRKYSPVLPYFWFRYRDGGYMSEVDLSTALNALYNSNASGFIIWGSSNDVNTVDKCQNLLKYVETTLGPAIAKYTKANTREDEIPSTTENLDLDTEINETSNNTPSITNVSTSFKVDTSADNMTIVNTKFIPIDPKFPWEPPANYSQEISHYVEEELITHPGYNETKLEKEFANLNRSVLMEIMINSILGTILDPGKINVLKDTNVNKTIDDEYQTNPMWSGHDVDNTKQIDGNILTSTSHYALLEPTYINSIVTNNPLKLNGSLDSELIDQANLLNKEREEHMNITTESSPKTTENSIYTDTTTDNYDFTSQRGNYISSMNPHDIVIDTAEGTTETLIPNATIFNNSNIIYDQKTVTENDELFSSTTDVNSIFLENTDFITEHLGEFITDRSNTINEYKKDNNGLKEEFLELSTDSPFERSEPEQVVIYIS